MEVCRHFDCFSGKSGDEKEERGFVLRLFLLED